MKHVRLIMNMPVIVEISDIVGPEVFAEAFDYFHYIDNTFSTFKKTSEISKINDGSLKLSDASLDVQEILRLAHTTKNQTAGFFDIQRGKKIDPSGIVKGWAIHNAAGILRNKGITNFYVEVGGDIEVSGTNPDGKPWTVGIRNPFNVHEIVKVVRLDNKGIATSGTYERGNHIYIPQTRAVAEEILSMTVIAPNAYEADRFATAAFAMGTQGIRFIETMKNFAGYMIDKNGIATMTNNFTKYIV